MEVKALTICQPYAHLICTPQSELPFPMVQKRVENRSWPTAYRGLLLIHAGKSTSYLDEASDSFFPRHTMQFGAIIGAAQLVECFTVPAYRGKPGEVSPRFGATTLQRFPWLEDHPHTEGPWCWILEDAIRFEDPVPCQGALGLWTRGEDVWGKVREQFEKLGESSRKAGSL